MGKARTVEVVYQEIKGGKDEVTQTKTGKTPAPIEQRQIDDEVSAHEAGQTLSPKSVNNAKELINLDWLKESLKILGWKNKDVISWLCETFNIEPKPSLTETIKQSTEGQTSLFINEINARLK